MRDIKFRAWDNIHNIMISHYSAHEALHLAFIGPDNFKVMQYTGLKDKNDKEIYEGDIVRSGMTGAEYLIHWHDDNCSFRKQCVNANKKDVEIWQDNSSIRIIGNICESPELLKGES